MSDISEHRESEKADDGELADKRLHLLGIGVAVAFWLLDAVVDAFLFRQFPFVKSLFAPELKELWMRTLIVSGVIGFGFYAQRSFLKLRRAEAAAHQVQKLEALGCLCGGVARDFNNLLTVIDSNASLIADALPTDAETVRGDLYEIRTAVDRGSNLIKRMLSVGRQEMLVFRQIDLNRLIEQSHGALRALLPENVELEFVPTPSASLIRGDPVAVEQIVVNLLTNARDAMAGDGIVRIETQRVLGQPSPSARRDHDCKEYMCLSVSDTGVGMDTHTKHRVFEPFFTTKPRGQGTGLGLWSTYGLVTEHGAAVDVMSEPQHGTTISVYFPVADEEVPDETQPQSEKPKGGTETILLAEDDAAICRSTKRVLERFGYTVLTALDGEQALDLFRTHRAEVALVITDVVMPKRNGSELYDAVKQESPETMFLFVSGYAPAEVRRRTVLNPEVPFLAKPWAMSELLTQVRELLDQARR